MLADCVLKGVAFHYANIPKKLRQEIERAFSDSKIRYLVCTSTLLQGVNLPAKSIFMFKPTKGQNRPLRSADFWNLSGRARRLRSEFQGNIMVARIKELAEDLQSVIEARGIKAGRAKKIELETAFTRLFTDFKSAVLDNTFGRLNLSDDEKARLRSGLADAQRTIALPVEILRRSQNVSAHKQQALYQKLKEKIVSNPGAVPSLIPLHPSDVIICNGS